MMGALQAARRSPEFVDRLRFDVSMDVGQLDAVSAVLGAIAAPALAGAGDAVKDMTKASILGTRDRLVALVRGRLRKDPVGDAKLTVYAAEPTPTNGKALEGHLIEAGVGEDQTILTLAREVLTAAGPAALGPGSLAANIINQVINDQGIGYQGGYHIHNHAAAAPAHAASVRWDLIPVRGQVFELRNIGDGPAHDVEVTAENAVRFDPPDTSEIWTPGSGREFFAAGSSQTGHPAIRVTWREDGVESRAWTRPLPR